jgi:hypothetical protein
MTAPAQPVRGLDREIHPAIGEEPAASGKPSSRSEHRCLRRTGGWMTSASRPRRVDPVADRARVGDEDVRAHRVERSQRRSHGRMTLRQAAGRETLEPARYVSRSQA